ncbi:MAG TPA: helical backbone metal receptor [Gemmatimonadaceae bacterium]|nr:helical backbone metal receptor [Gemmatimonadaceae bacterium]
MPRSPFQRVVWVVAALAAVACEAPARDERSAALPVDDFGAAVDTTAAPAARIVSLIPATTEILFAIGAGERVVGRSEWDQWPAEARAVTAVGPGLRPNVEAVLARRPDLVVLYGSEDNRAAAGRLEAAGVRVVALKIDRIAHVDRALRLLGALSGQSASGDSIARALATTLDSVRSATDSLPRPRVFWHIWRQPLITIGAGSYMHELLEIAGAENVYADLAAVSPPVNLEDVVRRDPDIVLSGPNNAADVRNDPRWQALRAVREGRIVVVDTILVGRPSVMLGAAAAHLAERLHQPPPQ